MLVLDAQEEDIAREKAMGDPQPQPVLADGSMQLFVDAMQVGISSPCSFLLHLFVSVVAILLKDSY